MAKTKVTQQTVDNTGTTTTTILENAATDQAVREVTAMLKILNKGNADANVLARRMSNMMSIQGFQNTDLAKNFKDSASAQKGFVAKLLGPLQDMAGRAYRQEVDIKEDIKDIGKFAASIGSAATALGGLAASKLFTKLPDLGDKVTGMMSRLTGTLGKIGPAFAGVGEMATKFFEGGLEELIQYRQTFQEISKIGAGFGGDLLELKRTSGEMRMTIGEFSNILTSEAKNIAGIGLTVTDSVKTLGRLTQEYNVDMKQSANQLADLGFTTQDVNKMILRQMALNRRVNYEDEQLRRRQLDSVTELAKEMDAVSRLTGIQRDELQASVDASMHRAEVEATIMQMDMDGSKGVRKAMQSAIASVSQYGPGAVKALEEIFTQGTVTSEEGINALNAMGSAGDEVLKLGLRIRQGGDVSDLISDFGVAMMERMREADFLSLAKMGALGVETGQAAGEMLMSGAGAIRDALYKMAGDPENAGKTIRELYEQAFQEVRERQLAQAPKEESDTPSQTTGIALNRTMNRMEDTSRSAGTALSNLAVTLSNKSPLFIKSLDAVSFGLLESAKLFGGTNNAISDFADGIASKIKETSGTLADAAKKHIDKVGDSYGNISDSFDMGQMALMDDKRVEQEEKLEKKRQEIYQKRFDLLTSQGASFESATRQLNQFDFTEAAQKQLELEKLQPEIDKLYNQRMNALVSQGLDFDVAAERLAAVDFVDELKKEQKKQLDNQKALATNSVLDNDPGENPLTPMVEGMKSIWSDFFDKQDTHLETMVTTQTNAYADLQTGQQEFLEKTTSSLESWSERTSGFFQNILDIDVGKSAENAYKAITDNVGGLIGQSINSISELQESYAESLPDSDKSEIENKLIDKINAIEDKSELDTIIGDMNDNNRDLLLTLADKNTEVSTKVSEYLDRELSKEDEPLQNLQEKFDKIASDLGFASYSIKDASEQEKKFAHELLANGTIMSNEALTFFENLQSKENEVKADPTIEPTVNVTIENEPTVNVTPTIEPTVNVTLENELLQEQFDKVAKDLGFASYSIKEASQQEKKFAYELLANGTIMSNEALTFFESLQSKAIEPTVNVTLENEPLQAEFGNLATNLGVASYSITEASEQIQRGHESAADMLRESYRQYEKYLQRLPEVIVEPKIEESYTEAEKNLLSSVLGSYEAMEVQSKSTEVSPTTVIQPEQQTNTSTENELETYIKNQAEKQATVSEQNLTLYQSNVALLEAIKRNQETEIEILRQLDTGTKYNAGLAQTANEHLKNGKPGALGVFTS